MSIALRVRTTDSVDFQISVDPHASVQELQEKLAVLLKLDTEQKYVRLIYSGRLLSPESAPLVDFKVAEGSFVHAVVSSRTAARTARGAAAASARGGHDSDGSSSNSSSSGGSGERDAENTSDAAPSELDMANLRGFDLLMRPVAGQHTLDRDEVLSLRAYFRDDVLEYAESRGLQRASEESERDFQRRLEAAWMAAQGPHSEFQLNLRARSLFSRRSNALLFGSVMNQFDGMRSGSGSGSGVDAAGAGVDFGGDASPAEMGTFRDFMYGILMGFALGFMMIFCIWDRNVSHRQKLGILCGIMLQMVVSLAQRDAMQMAAASSSSEGTVGDGSPTAAAAGGQQAEEFETTIGVDRNGHRESIHFADLIAAGSGGGSTATVDAAHAAIAAGYLRGSRSLQQLSDHFDSQRLRSFVSQSVGRVVAQFRHTSTAS